MALRLSYLLLLCLVCGCLESKEPLCPKVQSQLDEKLLGTWNRIGESGSLAIKRGDPGTLKVLVKRHGLASPKEIDEQEFEAFICRSKASQYVNLVKRSVYDEKANERGEPGPTVYSFYRYRLNENGELSVYEPTYDAFKRAISKKQLNGKAWETTWGVNVILRDKGERIMAWLDNQKDAEGFSSVGVYRRGSSDRHPVGSNG